MVTDINIGETGRLVFVGDIHGNFQKLLSKSTEFTNTIFIICGDCGFGFVDTKKDKIKKMIKSYSPSLNAKNNFFIFLRGNHDNPEYFKHNNNLNTNRFILVDDYDVVTVRTNNKIKNILCVGGAISIDRKKRTINKSYWKNEAPVYDESKLVNLSDIDIVATHSSPSFVFPLGKKSISYYLLIDSELDSDLNKERQVFDNIYNYLITHNHKIEYWFYGHFHKYYEMKYENTMFICNDMCDSTSNGYTISGINYTEYKL